MFCADAEEPSNKELHKLRALCAVLIHEGSALGRVPSVGGWFPFLF